MSIISAFLTPNMFTIVTDTIEALQEVNNIHPSAHRLTGFKSKIFHYPHIKASTVALGLSSAAKKHTEFVNNNFITDATNLYELTLSKFIPELDMDQFCPSPLNPTIISLYIFGYSESERKLVAYHIGVLKDRTIVKEQFMLHTEFDNGVVTIMWPNLNEDDHTFIEESFKLDNMKVSFHEYAIRSATRAHSNYVKYEPEKEERKIPVGGELHLTLISAFEGKYTASTSVHYRFPDFDSNVNRIKAYHEQQEVDNRRLECITAIGEKMEEILNKHGQSLNLPNR